MTHKIGNQVFIQEQEPDACEICDAVDELRPYGKFDEAKGRRLKVCFDCMKKDEPEAEKAYSEFMDGKTQ